VHRRHRGDPRARHRKRALDGRLDLRDAHDRRRLVGAQEQLEVAHQRGHRLRAGERELDVRHQPIDVDSVGGAALAEAPDALVGPVQRRHQTGERVGDFVREA
jgi:hypothetical protein